MKTLIGLTLITLTFVTLITLTFVTLSSSTVFDPEYEYSGHKERWAGK